jgi:hypothetical protein
MFFGPAQVGRPIFYGVAVCHSDQVAHLFRKSDHTAAVIAATMLLSRSRAQRNRRESDWSECMPVFSLLVHQGIRSRLGAFLVVVCPTVAGHADLVQTWEIGEGQSSAMIQFDFLAGNTYMVDVAFDGVISGQEALDLIVANSNEAGFDFNYEVITYSFGDFLVGMALDGDGDYGDGSTPPYIDYWHYWTQESDTNWTESMIGFSDRILTDGAVDGWVFGTTDAPTQIPAPATLALAIPALFGFRRRRKP